MTKWYAVMTNPRLEEIANRNLKRGGYYTFYPFQRVRRRRKRANLDKYLVEWINAPYFPGYLFVAIRPGESLYGVNETDGVSTVVYSGDEALEIPPTVMDRIMEGADSNGQVGSVDRVARKPLAPGQRITFKDNSPLSGLLAQIALDTGKEVRVWVEMLGGRRQIAVDPAVVAEIAP